MPVRIEDIAVGRCYVTSTYRVRKVLFISGENVRYVSRGSKNFVGWERSGYRATSTRARFAQDVDRRVTCDWDMDYPDRTPSD
jgi:hypothetical protein